MHEYRGGCLCGAVRWVARSEPMVVRACWCRVCQYFASGNATINVAFDAASFELQGELRDYPADADSGRRMHRRFCPVCGVHVTSSAEERPHMVTVRAGTFDDPDAIAPQGVIWSRSAPAWASLDPSIEHFPGQPPVPLPGGGRR